MADPFLREVVQHALAGIVDEAGIFSARSAYSPSVNEGAEIASALFDAAGRLVAQSRGALMHVSALRCMLPEVLAAYPPETLAPGDVLISNDVYRGGIHPTDVGVFRPIFHEGRPAFFYGGLMIVSDLGGLSAGGLPANASECFHEGITIPAVKLFVRGEQNTDVLRMIQANSRTPQRVRGDILALAAGASLADSRVREMLDRHGLATLEAVVDELLDHGERIARVAIAAIPDGRYHGAYEVEEDGVEAGRTHHVEVTVIVEGSTITMDFTGTGPRAKGAINSSWSQSLSACIYALRCYLDADVPWSEGVYRPLEVVFPAGSLVHAPYPAATNIRMAVVHAMIDSIYQALAPVFPERTVAPCAAPFVFTVSGAHADGSLWTLLDLNTGTMGARPGKDGIDGTSSLLYGQSGYGRSVEAFETEYPVRYHWHRLGTDSAGPGRWRGGCGIVKHVEFLTDAELTVRSNDRSLLPPLGIAGGGAGRAGAWILNDGRADRRALRPKETNVPVRAGDTLTAVVPGGGGYGDPAERDPAAVAADLRLGRVSPEAARRDYHVEVGP